MRSYKMAFCSVCALWRLALFISVAGTAIASSPCTPCTFNGPQLDCLGFNPCNSSVDHECYCRVCDSVRLQYGQCMELTVDVTNSSAALSCMWFANNEQLFKNDYTHFFTVGGDKNQTLTFRREFSEFYFTSLITFNCTDSGLNSSVVYKMNDIIIHKPECKEFDFRQDPYVVSSKEQVQLTTISGSSLTLGPVVVKKLPVGNSQPGGRWCNRNSGGCCNFSLSSTMSTTDCLLSTTCGGGMEGWRLLCSLECENGLLSFSLFKDSVSRGDSGDYVFTFGNDINNLAINGDNLTTTNVDVKLPTVAVVVISVMVPLVVVVIVLVVVAVVGCGVRLLKRGDQERAGLADELHAEPGENDRLVQVPDNDENNRPRLLTSNSVYLDLGGSTLSNKV